MTNHFIRVLSVRPFLYLWLSEIFSQVAINMLNFILLIVAFEISKSNTAVAGIVLSYTIPAVIFGLLAGIYVDRWSKKKVLLITNLLRVLVGVLFIFLHANLFFIYLLSTFVSIVTQFFIPAETPIIPLIVEGKLLLSANALFGMGIYGSILVAYTLTGPFLIFFGKTYVFAVLALLFLIASFLISLIKVPKKGVLSELKNEQRALSMPLSHEIKQAISVISKTKDIYTSLITLTLSQVLILIFAAIGPGYANDVLGITVDEFPIYFVTPAALGTVVGAVLLGNYFNAISKQKSATIGVFLAGFATILMPFGSKVITKPFIETLNIILPRFLTIDIAHIVVVLAFILGFANALIFVPSNTILQEATTDEFRGKVYGALNALVGAFSLIPIIAVGAFADVFGVSRVLVGIGIFILFIGLMRVIYVLKK